VGGRAGTERKVGKTMKDWLVQCIGIVLTHVSGQMRELLIDTVKEWEEKAKETKNPWDDLLVWIVKCLLLIP